MRWHVSMDETVVAYTRWIIRWRWTVMAATLLFTLLCGYQLRYMVFNDDYRVFFAHDNPRLVAYEKVQNAYSRHEQAFFVVTPTGGEVFTPRVLEAISSLTEESWKIPYAIRVDSITNFQHSWAEGDDLFVGDLIDDPAAMADDKLAAAQEIAVHEPLLLHRLIDPQASVTGVNVTLHQPGDKVGSGIVVVKAARELQQKTEQRFPEVRIGLTGIVPLNHAFLEATIQDLVTMVPLILAVVIGIIVFLMRSVVLAGVTVAVTVISALSAVGITVALGYEMSGPVVPGPVMVLTLGVADSIHILITLLVFMRQGRDKEAALVESMRVNMAPVFLTSLTTCIGFLSMNANSVPPVRLMGNIAALGVALAFVLSVASLPAAVAILPVRNGKTARHAYLQPAMEALGEWVIRRRFALICATVLATILTAVFIPRIRVNNQFIEWFDESIPIRQDTEYVMEHLTGIYQLTFSLGAQESGGVCDPAYLQALDAFTRWLEAQPGVLHVSSLSSTMKRLNKNMHGDDPAMSRIPESRELAAQYLLLYEMSLPYGLDLNTEINVDKSATRVIVTMSNLRSTQIRDLAREAEQWLRDNVPQYMFSDALGPPLIFSEITDAMMHTMLVSMPFALILVSLSLVVVLRSVKFGLLSLIPNLMPLAMGYGIWGMLGRDMNFGMAGISAMSLGIVVDDTIHFLSKYLRARREKGLSVEDAVRYGFSSVGIAMWVTSFTLAAGFAIMLLSVFLFTVDMGILTGTIIVCALVCDLFFLPPMLMYTDRKQYEGVKPQKESKHG